MVSRYFRTCNCTFNNPSDAKICNRCGKCFQVGDIIHHKEFLIRWECSCSAVNRNENDTCYGCGYIRPQPTKETGCFDTIMEFGAALFIFAMVATFIEWVIS